MQLALKQVTKHMFISLKVLEKLFEKLVNEKTKDLRHNSFFGKERCNRISEDLDKWINMSKEEFKSCFQTMDNSSART